MNAAKSRLLVLCCLFLSLSGGACPVFAYTPVGPVTRSDREEVLCFFSILRSDGSMVVNMQPGTYGKIYRNASRTMVKKDGALVGFAYLREGMPIKLIIQNGLLTEIQVRTTGGK